MSNVFIPDAIDVKGKPVFFMQSGPRDGKRVLLVLHGFMSDYRSLLMVAENLAVDDDTTILLPDLPGFGSSEPLSEVESTLGEYVDWVGDFLKLAAPQAEHVTMFGYSFGSFVAIRYAAENPGRVDNLLLLTPVIKVAIPVRLYTTIFETLADLSVEAAHAIYKWRPHYDFTSLYLARSRHPERVLRMLKHRREELPSLRPKVVLGLSSDLLKTDLLECAPKIHARVFTIIAKRDTLAVNGETEHFMAELPPAEHETHTLKCGHLVPFEEPELVYECINEHFFGAPASSKN